MKRTSKDRQLPKIEKIKNQIEIFSGLKYLIIMKKKSEAYYIYHPTFPDVQRTKEGSTAYRQGIRIDPVGDLMHVSIMSAYSPFLAQQFMNNSSEHQLFKLFKDASKICSGDFWITWDSKHAWKHHSKIKKEIHSLDSDCELSEHSLAIRFDNKTQFQKLLKRLHLPDNFWKNDFGIALPSTGKNILGIARGYDFEFRGILFKWETRKLKRLLKAFAPFLHNFFPTKPYKRRTDNLKRHLSDSFKKMNKTPICALKGCNRRHGLEAAHIIPYIDCENDHPSNGVWLCKSHHRLQEGKPLKWQRKHLKVSETKHTDLVISEKSDAIKAA